MSVVYTTFVLIVALVIQSPSDSNDAANTAIIQSTNYSADSVAALAAAASVPAALLDSERDALGCELQRDDATQCAQVGLLQSVLKDLVADRRDESTADALAAFYRLIALNEQRELLVQSDQVLDTLLGMASRAEQLDLPDGNARDLKQQRLDVASQLITVRFGISKLQRRLAQLIDRPVTEIQLASLTPNSLSGEPIQEEATAIQLALANRGDYLSTATLCRCVNADSLPAVKPLMSILQPGMGLATSGTSKAFLLTKLSHRVDQSSELGCRRRQCQAIREQTSSSISEQVSTAFADRTEAQQRLAIALQIEKIAGEATKNRQVAESIDQASPGSQQTATLAELKRKAERIERERDCFLAEVNLRRAMGTLAPE